MPVTATASTIRQRTGTPAPSATPVPASLAMSARLPMPSARYVAAIERVSLGSLGVLGLPVALALALAWVARPAAAGPSVAPQTTQFDAQQVYLRDCAVCHGSTGEGTPRGPEISNAGGALVDYQLSTGRMPIDRSDEPVRRGPPRYDRAQRAALVDYVAAFGQGLPVPTVDIAGADLPRGGELYRLNCAACHSWSGTGGALLAREAPPLDRSTPVQAVEAVRTGPGSMPSFGQESFSDAEVDDIAAYVRELQHPEDRGGNPLLHLGPFPEGAVAWVFGIGALVLFINWVGEQEKDA